MHRMGLNTIILIILIKYAFYDMQVKDPLAKMLAPVGSNLF